MLQQKNNNKNDAKFLTLLKRLDAAKQFYRIKEVIEASYTAPYSKVITQYYIMSLCHMGLASQARAYFKTHYSQAIPSDLVELYLITLFLTDRFEVALEVFKQYEDALSADQIVKIKNSLKFMALRSGDFDQFKTLNTAVKLPKDIVDYVAQKNLSFWQGESLKDKKILLICDQGLGDTIFYSRYVAYLKAHCKACYFLPQDALHPLFEKILPANELLKWGAKAPDVDIVLPTKMLLNAVDQMDLPPLDFSNLPTLKLTDDFARDKLKVGLCWSGSQSFFWDSLRSISFEMFNKICAVDGVRYYALQEDVDKSALSYFKIDPAREKMQSILQLAALIKSMDLVITVDTMIAHLAASLGVKTWVLCRASSDWRWEIDEVESRWYDTVRLFKQDNNQPFEWAPVLEDVRQALIKQVDDTAPIDHAAEMKHAASKYHWKEVIYHTHFLPNSAATYFARGKAHKFLYQPLQAAHYLEKALALSPNDADIKSYLIDYYIADGALEKSFEYIQACEKSLKNKARLYRSYAKYYIAKNDIEAGEQFFKNHLKNDPDHAEFYHVLGMLAYHQKQFDIAKKHFAKAVSLAPQKAFYKWAQSDTFLLNGDWEQGLALYEARFDTLKGFIPDWILEYPKWQGDSLKGKTILLASEQGLGDMIFFSRLLACYERQGVKEIVFYVREDLKVFFEQSLPKHIKVISQKEEAKDIDVYFPIVSTMHQMKLSQKEFSALPSRIDFPDAIAIEAEGKLKIGLVWAGNTSFANNHQRSLSLDDFAPLIKAHDAHYFSLQNDADIVALDQYDIVDLRSQFKSIEALASVIKGLNLVITVDTMIAHLAASLGVKTFMLINDLPDWRWGMTGDQTPYYPTMQLFRKESAAQPWADVVATIIPYLSCYEDEKRFRNMIVALRQSDQSAEVEKQSRAFLKQYPKSEFAYTQLFVALKRQKKLDESLALIKNLVKKFPHNHLFHNFLGHQLLRQGRFKDANPSYQHRFKIQKYLDYDLKLTQPQWAGEKLDDSQILLVIGEQGLGDKINFVRFVPLLEQYAKKIIFLVHPNIAALFQGLSSDKITILSLPKQGIAYSKHVPLMSVPGILGYNDFESVANIPLPKLATKPIKSNVIEGKKLKVGFNLQGNQNYMLDRLRSIDSSELKHFLNLDIEGYNLSLETDEYKAQLIQIREDSPAIEELAEVIRQMDLVITVDSMIAHLAGSLGVETWVFIPYVPDWRWQSEGETSFWYPSMKLFRQATHDSGWSDVVQKVRYDLQARLKPLWSGRAYANKTLLVQGSEVPLTQFVCSRLIPKLRRKIKHIVYVVSDELYPILKKLSEYATIVKKSDPTPDHDFYITDTDLVDKLRIKSVEEFKILPAYYFGGAEEPLIEKLLAGPETGVFKDTLRDEQFEIKAPFIDSAKAAYQDKKYDQARILYAKAIAEDNVITHEQYYHFINAIYQLGHFKDVMTHIKQLLEQTPDDVNLLNMLAFCHEYLGDHDKAMQILRRNCELLPDDWKTIEFYLNMLREDAAYSEIETLLDNFYKRTKDKNALFQMAINHYHLGKSKQGIKAATAYLKDEDKGQMHVNRALLYFQNGEFAKAKKDYEHRTEFFTMYEHQWQFDRPKWDGKQLSKNQVLLIAGEQGLGDRIQMMRFIPYLLKRAPNITLLLNTELYHMRDAFDFGDIKVLKAQKKLPKYDFYLPLMDVIFQVGLTQKTVKDYPPLGISPPKVDLDSGKKLKVGLNFLGNHLFLGDKKRSVAFDDFKALFHMQDIQFYNLCKEVYTQDLSTFNIIDLREKYVSLSDLASVMNELDLVITVDSMIAHLAGSLGVKCYLLTPYAADWRWGVKGRATDWYPSITLYRQKEEGTSWEDVVSEILKSLHSVKN